MYPDKSIDELGLTTAIPSENVISCDSIVSSVMYAGAGEGTRSWTSPASTRELASAEVFAARDG
jgi:hypothetical protein